MTQDRVMLLIDADNVSVDVMEQAVKLLLNQHGALHVRRAYCTAEGAVKHQAIFKHLGIKPMVNLAAGKNSTDIAMAVDAIDLVLAERPDVVVIASSDSDFAPLVQRLREKGCVVRGIGQQGKTGDETQGVYDDFTVLEHRKSASSTAETPAKPARKTAARKAAAKAPAAKKAVVAKKVAAKTAASKTPARKSGARKAVAALTPTAMAPARIQYIDLHLDPAARSSFTTECSIRDANANLWNEPLEYKLFYTLSHYHVLGMYQQLEIMGGPRDGEVIMRHDGIGNNAGTAIDPPLWLVAL